MPTVNLPDGRKINFPDGTPEAEMGSAIDSLLKTDMSVPMDKAIDQRRGAPSGVRAAVGAAQTDADRLSTLRKTYPDAQPYEEGNFVFTDPKTKRPTLYNPKGFDAGDIVSVGPEIAEFMGGTAGGIAAASAVPATGGTSLLAVPAGVGLGAAAGRELYGRFADSFYGTQDTRSLPQRLADTAVVAGMNASGQRVGDLVGQGIKAVAGPVMRYGRRALAPTGAAAVNDFANASVTPSAGAVTGNTFMQTLEKWLAGTPGGANPMRELGEKQVAEMSSEADRLARAYGGTPPKTAEEIGGTIKQAAKGAAERFKSNQEKLYDDAFSKIGEDTPVAIAGGNVDQLMSKMQTALDKAPESLKPTYEKAMKRIGSLFNDADASGNIPFATVRQIRTQIGRELNDPVLAGVSGTEQPALRELYGALSADIKATAQKAGPDAAKALELADRYTRFNMSGNIPVLQKIVDTGTDAQAFEFAMRGAKNGGEQLRVLKRNFKPDEWDQLAGTVLGRMGRAKPGQQGATAINEEASDFSINTFMTNWNNMSVEARKELFGGTRYSTLAPQLDRLFRVASRLKDTDAVANPSGTGRMIAYGASMAGAGAAANDMMSGDVAGGAKLAALTVVAPRAAAKLITTPSFVRWLADSGRTAGQSTLPAQVARLSSIAKINPEIRDEIDQYFSAIGR